MLIKHGLLKDGFFRVVTKHILFLLLINAGYQVIAQDEGNGIDRLYGFDPFLYNGTFYTYKVPGNAQGSPFLSDKGFEKGSITILNKTYQDLSLNYDVYNQALLLKFADRDGATNIIEIPESWLEKFTIGSSEFEVVKLTGEPVICQAIKSGPVKVQYFWTKELKLDNVFGKPAYVYLQPKRVQVITVTQKAYHYKKNKEFIKGFEPSIRSNISDYIRSHRIKVAKSPDTVISALVKYCNSQINP